MKFACGLLLICLIAEEALAAPAPLPVPDETNSRIALSSITCVNGVCKGEQEITICTNGNCTKDKKSLDNPDIPTLFREPTLFKPPSVPTYQSGEPIKYTQAITH